MHTLAWAAHPYAYKPRGLPMVTPSLRFPRLESMQMDNGRRADNFRQCAGCGHRCGRTARCFRCSSVAPNFEDELARLRIAINDHNQNRVRIMEEGNINHANNNLHNNNVERIALNPVQVTSQNAAEVTCNNTSTNTLPDNFNRFRMGGLNWGVWGCFIFATVLLVPSHIYLKKYDYRGELLGIFFVLTILFLVCFSVSMFHSKTREILLHRLHLEENIRPYPSSASPSMHRRLYRRNLRLSSRTNNSTFPLRRVRSTPELHVRNSRSSQRYSVACHYPRFHPGRRSSRSSIHSTNESNLDPPPYHLAILLPNPPPETYTRRCETPPPSYDLVTNQ